MELLTKNDIRIFELEGQNLSIKSDLPFELEFWPVVYILYNEDKLYIGETMNWISRFNKHSKDPVKKELNKKLVITSDYFNKSVILQLEAYLLTYLSGDGKFKILNLNTGLNQHYYYNQKLYEDIFPEVWNILIEKKIVENPLTTVNNLNLFKFSPYKILYSDQQQAVLDVLEGLKSNNKTILIKGSAGTGKTILAIYLMKLLCTPIADNDLEELDDTFSHRIAALTRDIQIMFPNLSKESALVVPVSSLRATLKKVFKNIQNLSSNMVITPTEVSKGNYQFLIIDEAHRLKRRLNLANYSSHDNANKLLGIPNGDELDWVLTNSKSKVLFYDKMQSIKPGDVIEEKFTDLSKKSGTINLSLKSQIRSNGGDLYSDFVTKLMHVNLKLNEEFISDKYEFLLFDRVTDLKDRVKKRNAEFGLSRIIAGFSWEWKSRNNDLSHDFEIEEIKFRWNSKAVEWINSVNAINEVGSIHKTMGYDLEYAGIIFGNEIGYDIERKMIVIRPDEYKDKYGKSNTDSESLKKFIINIYQSFLLRARSGTYIYCCDENLREYFKGHMRVG